MRFVNDRSLAHSFRRGPTGNARSWSKMVDGQANRKGRQRVDTRHSIAPDERPQSAPAFTEPLSIGTRMWYHDTAQVPVKCRQHSRKICSRSAPRGCVPAAPSRRMRPRYSSPSGTATMRSGEKSASCTAGFRTAARGRSSFAQPADGACASSGCMKRSCAGDAAFKAGLGIAYRTARPPSAPRRGLSGLRSCRRSSQGVPFGFARGLDE
jgi:hypothetical protein